MDPDDRRTRYRRRIVEGNILKTMVWLAWPILVANLVNISYNLVDAFWLGKIGKETFGAPTVSWPLINLMYSIGYGYAGAAISLISQYYGAGDYEMAEKSASQFIGYSIYMALVLCAFGYAFSPHLLYLMGVPPDIYGLAVEYTRTIFLGLPIVLLGYAYIAISNSIGDTRTPTILNITSSTVNIILDPIMIFGLYGFPAMGVVGAAIATVISRAIVSVAGGYLLFRGYLGIRIRVKYFKLEGWWLRKIFSIGTPLAIQRSSNSLGFTIMMSIVSRFGSVVVAAYGVAIRIIDVLTAITGALQRSTSIMIGQNVGAEKYDRAWRIAKTALLSVFIILLLGSIVLFVYRSHLVSAFISEPEVIAEGSKIMSIFTWSIPFFGLFFIAGAIAIGSGHTRFFAIISIIRLWALRIGLSILFALIMGWGSTGIYIAMALSNIVAGLLSIIWAISKRWLKRVI
ncbi:MAG: MATE family efflux transporter [Thermoprotei archaeon]|nr:MAG: MATE family efflux transporter [Thermoprotei archaeon]